MALKCFGMFLVWLLHAKKAQFVKPCYGMQHSTYVCGYSLVYTLVHALEFQGKCRQHMQVAAGDSYHKCKWSICARYRASVQVGAEYSNNMQLVQWYNYKPCHALHKPHVVVLHPAPACADAGPDLLQLASVVFSFISWCNSITCCNSR